MALPVPGGRPVRPGHRRAGVTQARQAARRFFTGALAGATSPTEVSTDRAAAYPRVLDELLPAAYVTVPYANNRVEVRHEVARYEWIRGKGDRQMLMSVT